MSSTPDGPSPADAWATDLASTSRARPVRQRVLFWLNVAALLLLIVLTAWVSIHERLQAIEDAQRLVERRVQRLAGEIERTLAIADVAIAQVERRLDPSTGTGDVSATWQALREQAALLASLPLPLTLHALDAEGRVLDVMPAAPSAAAMRIALPTVQAGDHRWLVALPQRVGNELQLPLIKPAAPNAVGVAAYVVHLPVAALAARFEQWRDQRGSSVALFRVDPASGAAHLLARAPLVIDDIGQPLPQRMGQSVLAQPAKVLEGVTPVDGVRRILAFQRLGAPADAMAIVYGMDTQEVLAGWRLQLPVLLLGSLLLAALITLGSHRLGQSLRASERQRKLLDKAFDVLPDMLFLIDVDGTIRDHRSGQRSDLLLAPSQFLGRPMADTLPPNMVEQFKRQQQAALANQPAQFEYDLMMPNGQAQHFEARLARVPDTDQVVAVVRNITERQQFELARDRQQRFIVLLVRLATNFINLPKERLDHEIHQALGDMGEFVKADRAYVFDYDFDESASSNTHEWCAAGIDPQRHNLQRLPLSLIPDWVNAHARGEVFEVPDVQALPAGELRDTLEPQGIRSLITLPLSSHRGCLGFVGFDSVHELHTYDEDEVGLLRLFAQMLVHVHERGAAEAELRRLTNELEQRVEERTHQLDASVQRLSRLNRELEAFTYSVSHDLKAPLRGIDGYAALLQEEHAGALPPEAKHFLSRIQNAAQQMSALINDLLAFSRLERQDQFVTAIDARVLVDDALASLGNEIDLTGVQLSVDLPPALWVQADRVGLGMALRNLLDNAIKFSRKSAAPAIAIQATQENGEVTIAIRDNGVGFDMKYHDRIFTIFQRLHTVEAYAGTGIGLAMVHKAIDRMGGRIWARSAPGEGATFFIALHVAEPPSTSALPAAD